jgi:hypothetical protein
MKIINIIILNFIALGLLHGQDFNSQASASCTINANAPAMFNGIYYRERAIDATFRVCGAGACCTGTLVNRNTDDEHLGFYFITAHHCFSDANFIGNESEATFQFVFNYQSPDAVTLNTPEPNRGLFGMQKRIFIK